MNTTIWSCVISDLQKRLLIWFKLILRVKNLKVGLLTIWLQNCSRTMAYIVSTLIFGLLGVSYTNWQQESLLLMPHFWKIWSSKSANQRPPRLRVSPQPSMICWPDYSKRIPWSVSTGNTSASIPSGAKKLTKDPFPSNPSSMLTWLHTR